MQRAAEKQYDYFLKDVQKIMGEGMTYSNDLHKLCSYLFGSKFTGVFARDMLPRDAEYAIVNTDTSDKGGVHWLAVGNGLIYDSFGRDLGFKMERTQDDTEQDVLEANCGQRCIAFLCVYHAMGRDSAKFI